MPAALGNFDRGGVLWLVIGQAIPRSWVLENARGAYGTYQSLGVYSSVTEGTFWDNFTDTLFINAAVTEYDGNILEKAIANAYTSNIDEEGANIITCLGAAVNGDTTAEIVPYSRYWAGTMTLYKIMLIFTSITGIRTFISVVAFTLIVVAILCSYQQMGYKGAIPLLLVIALFQFVQLALCLVYSTDIILMSVAIILCARFYQKGNFNWKAYTILFGVIGTLCAYLGYWAFPVITVGMPLAYLATLRIQEGEQEKVVLKDTIWLSVIWLCGVVATIGIKQVLCVLVLGSEDGVAEMLFRMEATIGNHGRILTVLYVLWKTLSVPLIFLGACIIFVLLVLFLVGFRKERILGWSLLLVSLYPVGWSFILTGHMSHGFNIYMYAVAWYGALCFLCLNMQRKKLAKNRKC